MGGVTEMKVKMKNRIIVIMAICCMSLFVAAFASIGYKVKAEEVQSKFGLTSTNFEIKGASLRKVDGDWSAGVKFHVTMNKDVFETLPENATTGVKILPKSLLGEGETLSDTANGTVIDKQATKNGWFDNDDGKKELIVYVYDIPADNYGTDLAVIAYVTANPTGEETAVTEYTAQNTFALAEVALTASDSETEQTEKDKLKNYYTFKLKTYGEDGTEFGTQDVKYGDKLTELDAPTSSDAGKKFCGWQNKSASLKWDVENDTVKGNVSLYPIFRGNPEITLSEIGNFENDILNCVEQTEVKLPVATADNAEVTMTSNDLTIKDGKATAASKGSYTVTYTATDVDNAELVSTKEITVQAYRKVLKANTAEAREGITVSDGLKDDDEQVLTVSASHDGVVGTRFNMAASTQYYAEATYTYTYADEKIDTPNPLIGLAHFADDNTQYRIALTISGKNGTAYIKYLGSNGKGGFDGVFYANGGVGEPPMMIALKDKNCGTLNDKSITVKVAIARNGDKFYSFINDALIDTYDFDYADGANSKNIEARKALKTAPTVPGINGVRLNNTTIGKISWLSGETAVSKINALVPGANA